MLEINLELKSGTYFYSVPKVIAAKISKYRSDGPTVLCSQAANDFRQTRRQSFFPASILLPLKPPNGCKLIVEPAATDL